MLLATKKTGAKENSQMNGTTLQIQNQLAIEENVPFVVEPWNGRKTNKEYFRESTHFERNGQPFVPKGTFSLNQAHKMGLTKCFLLKAYNVGKECTCKRKVWSTGKKAAYLYFRKMMPEYKEAKIYIHKLSEDEANIPL